MKILQNRIKQLITDMDNKQRSDYKGSPKNYNPFTPYKFATETGICTNTIYKFIKDPNAIPSSANLKKICETFQINPSEILELM